MTFAILTKEEFASHANSASYRSFMQTLEMASLLEKRGFKTQYVGWKTGTQITISALLYSMPMTGAFTWKLIAVLLLLIVLIFRTSISLCKIMLRIKGRLN